MSRIKNMKLVFLTTQAPGLTKAGGISLPTYRLARALAQRGHEIIWLVGRTEEKLSNEIRNKFRTDGIEIIRVQENRSTVSPWWLALQFEFQKILIDLRPDVIISQDWQAPCGLTANDFNRIAPIITWAHGGTYYDVIGSTREFSDVHEIILAGLEELQIRNSDLLVSPSQYLLDIYSSIQNLPLQCRVLPLLFPEQIRTQNTNQVCLAFVGALSSRKGFDFFVDSVLELKKRNLKFIVKIYGAILDLDFHFYAKMISKAGIEFTYEHHKSSHDICLGWYTELWQFIYHWFFFGIHGIQNIHSTKIRWIQD